VVDPGYIFVHKLIDRFVENDLIFGRNVFLPVSDEQDAHVLASLPWHGERVEL